MTKLELFKKEFAKKGLPYVLAGTIIATPVSVSALETKSETTHVSEATQNISVAQGINLVVEGKQVVARDANGTEVQPFIYNGSTYLPLRSISTMFGCSVNYNADTRVIDIATNAQTPQLDSVERDLIWQTNRNLTANTDVTVNINGKQLNLTDASGNKVDPLVVDGTTYLPVRAISNALGKTAVWHGDINAVFVFDPEKIYYKNMSKEDNSKIAHTVGLYMPYLIISGELANGDRYHTHINVVGYELQGCLNDLEMMNRLLPGTEIDSYRQQIEDKNIEFEDIMANATPMPDLASPGSVNLFLREFPYDVVIPEERSYERSSYDDLSRELERFEGFYNKLDYVTYLGSDEFLDPYRNICRDLYNKANTIWKNATGETEDFSSSERLLQETSVHYGNINNKSLVKKITVN